MAKDKGMEEFRKENCSGQVVRMKLLQKSLCFLSGRGRKEAALELKKQMVMLERDWEGN